MKYEKSGILIKEIKHEMCIHSIDIQIEILSYNYQIEDNHIKVKRIKFLGTGTDWSAFLSLKNIDEKFVNITFDGQKGIKVRQQCKEYTKDDNLCKSERLYLKSYANIFAGKIESGASTQTSLCDKNRGHSGDCNHPKSICANCIRNLHFVCPTSSGFFAGRHCSCICGEPGGKSKLIERGIINE